MISLKEDKMKYQTFHTPDTLTSSEDDSDYVLGSLFKINIEKQGYSVWTASVFIISFMAGMGVLALPRALAGSGWFGLCLIALACINSWYSAILLGRTWIILEERWEEYRGKVRNPYPAMGLRAVGPWMRYFVTATLQITLIGVGVVYILLCAQIAQSMSHQLFTLSYDRWIIILCLVLCPLTWFGRLEEFWVAAIGAMLTAAIACFSLFIGTLLEIPKARMVVYEEPTFTSMSLAFGTILFAFGGVFFFPNIQNDMSNRQQFNKATLLGFAGLLLLYMPVTLAGYTIFGSSVSSNILLSLPEGYLRSLIEACLAIHILLAFLLVINPVAQELEGLLQIEPDFNYKRCLVRSSLVSLILLIAYTIPHFDKILNLIGGSTMTLLTFIFPPVFYYFICIDHTKFNIYHSSVTNFEKFFLLQIMITGIAGGISCTYSAILEIVDVFYSVEPLYKHANITIS